MKIYFSIFIVLSLFIFSCKKEQAADNITNEYYTVVECDTTHTDSIITSIQLPEEFQAWAGIFDGDGVGAAINLTEDILVLFNLDGTKFAWFEDQEIMATYNLSDNNHFLENCPFSAISAAMVLNTDRFYIFNEDGSEYTAASFNVEDVEGSYNDDDFMTFTENVFALEFWGDDSIPFSNIGAMWNYSAPNNSCFDATEDWNYYWMVNGSGTEVIQYFSPYGTFNEPIEIENWTAENNCNGQDGLIPFTTVGAACRYKKPNTIQEIFFNQDGTQFSYHNVSEGVFSEVYNLYE
ncbi:MAG: hypothetical protein AB8B53_07030 [Flavobacteriales bacterium]